MSNVYIAHNLTTGVTKIGRGAHPKRRVKTFEGFTLLATYDTGWHDTARRIENIILKTLKPFLSHGKEWFLLPENTNLVKTFDMLVRKASIKIMH